MGVLNNIKAAAMSLATPPKKKLEENPTYHDLNNDGEDPILRPKKTGTKFFNADKDISKDRHGRYVPTMTYPLPPLSWEKQQFSKNRRIRNCKNKYL